MDNWRSIEDLAVRVMLRVALKKLAERSGGEIDAALTLDDVTWRETTDRVEVPSRSPGAHSGEDVAAGFHVSKLTRMSLATSAA